MYLLSYGTGGAFSRIIASELQRGHLCAEVVPKTVCGEPVDHCDRAGGQQAQERPSSRILGTRKGSAVRAVSEEMERQQEFTLCRSS